MGTRWVIGWDVGGAHLKACLLRDGQVFGVAQQVCPLWQGLEHLDRAVAQVLAAWPDAAGARHAVTMTGEMADCFANRQQGVQQIAERMAQHLGRRTSFFAGDHGWCGVEDAAQHWEHIASANWLATARHAAQRLGDGVLVDIGSTTTDFIAFRACRVLGTSRSDAQRLASGELVYHGTVRTPLCGVARRIRWRDTEYNVMNEFFATSADVYRLTGELNAAHDLHPSADGAAKDLPRTRQRLARMIGLDAHEGSDADWLAFAHAWRAEQVSELAGQLDRVLASHAVPAGAPLVSAGCGDFLVPSLSGALSAAQGGSTGRTCLRYGESVARVAADAPAGTKAWAQVCAPSVAVAALFDEAHADGAAAAMERPQ
ncbi:MAG: H4MPT-linked C1 transfer pathway protein [Methylibium sp. NZG]|nr:MAG: H4MPT-linked C1 transfer pathway protein [Methylibium sp. NZG]